MSDQKIKQDEIQIGKNIREIRKAQKIGQTELVRRLQLKGIPMTREALVGYTAARVHQNRAN